MPPKGGTRQLHTYAQQLQKKRIVIKTFTKWMKGFLDVVMILPQVHLRKPCYDFYFL